MAAPLHRLTRALLTVGLSMAAALAEDGSRTKRAAPREFLRNQVANTRSLLETMLRRADVDKAKVLAIYRRTDRWRRRPDFRLVKAIEDAVSYTHLRAHET